MVADILYDHDANRVAAAIGSVSTGYTYDRAGQLVSRVDGGSPTSYSYKVCRTGPGRSRLATGPDR
jgi:hypothetical protein